LLTGVYVKRPITLSPSGDHHDSCLPIGKVVTFNDPIEAKVQFREDAYDLVLLDVSMKPIDGFELYRQLLQVDNKVRVCFITAFEIYYDEFRKIFPKLRVDCFVRKPVSLNRLARIIRQELEITEEQAGS
jgi:two-component SAPR family response regulator